MLFRRKGCWFALWLAGLLLVSVVGRAASASADIERKDDDRKLQPDSLTVVRNVMSDMERPRKMSTSLYPVQLQVHGRLYGHAPEQGHQLAERLAPRPLFHQ